MQLPLVSIVIGCYNVAPLLLHGMKSILEQTYTNLEIWLVNDGSTDTTSRLCDQLAIQDSRIHVIHKENGGLASARNAGLKASHGDYIYFCDVDDELEPDLIETMVNLAQERATEMIIFSMDIHDMGAGTLDHIRFQDRLITSNEELKQCFCNQIFFSKHGNGFVWNKFYTASFLNRVKAKFGVERIQQDEPFNLRLYPHVNRLQLTSYKGYNYYLSPKTSTAARFVERKFEAVTSVYQALVQFNRDWLGNEPRFQEAAQRRYIYSLSNVFFYNFSPYICPWGRKKIIARLKELMEMAEVKNVTSSHMLYHAQGKNALLWFLLKKRHFQLLFLTERFYNILGNLKNTLFKR